MLAVQILTSLTGCSDGVDTAPGYPAENESPPCPLVGELYRIDSVELPTTVSEAAASGLDLDRDGHIDNALGQMTAMIHGSFGTAAQQWPESLGEALENDVRWFVAVDRCLEGDSDYARAALRRGVDLEGDGRDELIDDQLPPAVGRVDGRRLVASDGAGMVPMVTLMDILGGAGPGWLRSAGVAFDLERGPDQVAGVVTVGLPPPALDLAAPVLVAFFQSRLDAGTSEFSRDLDVDGDGSITEQEFLDHPLVRAFTALDIDLSTGEGDSEIYHPGVDGRRDHYSLGMYIRAHRTP
jgi:hypothetical protein